MKTKILAIVCVLMLVISCMGISFSAAPAETAEAQEQGTEASGTELFDIAENDLAKLQADLSTANIFLTDKATGQVWTAFPEGTSKSSIFAAMLNVTYLTGSGIEAVVQAPGNGSDFDIYQVKDGLKIVFNFTSETTGFSVPLIITLQDKYLEVSVDYANVKENSTGQVTSIEVLPNLLYGKSDESGYAFIPDGSGAIINYSDSVSRSESYSATVYGEDPSQNLLDSKLTDEKQVLMPVYGAVKNSSALLGVITGGDVYANIMADMADNAVTVSTNFVYRECDLTGIQSATGGERTLTITQKTPLKTVPKVRFYVLSGDNANYSGMANAYRNYLIEKGDLKEKNGDASAVSVMAYGAAPEQVTIFGIPITSVRPATTFKDLEKLYSELTKDEGETPSFYLYGFLDGGYGAKNNTDDKYISKLGGKKGYASFAKLAGTDNVFTVYNTERSFGRSFDFLRFKDYMSSLNQTVVTHHYRLSSNGRWDTEKGAWKYFTVDYQQKLISKLLKKLPNDYGIVPEYYGVELLSDFTTGKTVNRAGYLQFVSKAVEMFKKKGMTVALDGGNGSTLSLADEVYDIPLESSGFAMESYSVPFYTMVYHSYAKLSSSPVNLFNNSDGLALKAFEQGIAASYAVTGCDPHELRSTKFNFLYNSQYENLLPDMKKYTDAYKEVHTTLADKVITKHEYVGDLSVTTYENGWRIACNYGKTAVAYENQNIEPLGYVIMK